MEFILDFEAKSSNDKIFGTNKGARKSATSKNPTYQTSPNQRAYKAFRDATYLRIIKATGKQQTEGRTAWKVERFFGLGDGGKRSRGLYDHANLVGGFKPVIDSMIRAGLIEGDNTLLFKGFYFQERAEGDEGFVKITQLDPRGEIECGLRELAETFTISKELLLEVAEQTKLIKGENDENEEN